MAQDTAPTIVYGNRNKWENVRFSSKIGLQFADEASTTSLQYFRSPEKFAATVKVLTVIYQLLESNTYSTKRDIYYQDPKLFKSQAVVDGIVDNLSCMLKIPRWNLHVLATSKGCVAGELKYLEADGNFVDCSLSVTGVLIPSHVHKLTSIETNAKFILIVEKDATFQKLLDDGICAKLSPCIIITGKGFPDVNTRMLVRKLWDTFHLPTFALVDADPHGMEIMCVYKFGSKSLSFESHNLTVPATKWIGVLPSDIERLHIPKEVLIPLKKTDLSKAKELSTRPYFKSQAGWQNELQQMLSMGFKAEIQCLSAVSPMFLTDVYLPNKLRFGGWI